VRVTLDPNYRSKLWNPDEFRRVLRDLAARCDILLPGVDEAELLTGESDPEAAARDLRGLGPTCVVLKLGAQGALAVADDQRIHVPALRLERIIDPVGAGDAFAAGFLSGLLRGLEVTEALRLANRCGALAMSAPGDLESLPRRAEVEEQVVGDIRR
jgi:2-dehydro-3-deoxygluconokinase